MTRCAATSFSLIKSLLALALAFMVGGAWQLDVARAQVIERGVQGGVVGAIIGGLVGGGRAWEQALPLGLASVSSAARRKQTPMRGLAPPMKANITGNLRCQEDLASSTTSRHFWCGSVTTRARSTASMANARRMRSANISMPAACLSMADPRRSCSTS